MESKEFKNTYEDFSPDAARGILDCSEVIRLDNRFVDEIKRKLKELLKTKNDLEKKYEDRSYWSKISVYTGTMGIAAMYYRLSESFDSTYLEKAVWYTEKAMSANVKVRDASFLCGEAGLFTMGCLIYRDAGNHEKSRECLNTLLSMAPKVITTDETENELLYGRAGYLYCLLFLKSKGVQDVPENQIRNIIETIINSGKQLAKKRKFLAPLMYEWHGKCYLGAAHGIAGILFMLLQGKEYLEDHELQKLIRPTLDFLLTLKFPSGNYPSSLGNSSDRLVQWCHGAPGFTHLYCLAYQVFGDTTYLDAAVDCGAIIWSRGLSKKGYGICHGVSGNAYSFLVLFQATNEIKYLYRACKFAQFCLDYGHHGCRIADRPASLFEGIAGTIYFLSEIINFESAKFPGYAI